jgi:hypothetical protein
VASLHSPIDKLMSSRHVKNQVPMIYRRFDRLGGNEHLLRAVFMLKTTKSTGSRKKLSASNLPIHWMSEREAGP